MPSERHDGGSESRKSDFGAALLGLVIVLALAFAAIFGGSALLDRRGSESPVAPASDGMTKAPPPESVEPPAEMPAEVPAE